mmetsp:Transcript_40676/g.73286  ORF Transcript_40676/g.73286 Transcript_40676/m.73286 type:complete len:539 (+) Transcript_40676:89-1705(+)|eukprot:CAMPEP_0197664396 /NCGR_PEP_ID=MMETSP1338-20131121/58608_1 /TAXON_ID=43686 ORGANISM="Pelagodinium beii, Strain RCC1491" /NCGR_SAMPLE_ID=MMETSP1338 /ASSEMBLY_ACC=CAM_ASM_000754 /LENGTH=538 /DNA_ID=CAMNT_0043243023 /DNA_START=54 /DNA_END=1670 /DNA_ORIENTATION=+
MTAQLLKVFSLLGSWFISQAFRLGSIEAANLTELPSGYPPGTEQDSLGTDQDSPATGPVCVNLKESKKTVSLKALCEGQNKLQDGWIYIFNAGKGSGLARCGKALDCMCCKKQAEPGSASEIVMPDPVAEKRLSNAVSRIKSCAVSSPWSGMRAAMETRAPDRDPGELLAKYVATLVNVQVQQGGLLIGQGPLKFSGPASLTKALMVIDPARFATVAADIFCDGKTEFQYDGKVVKAHQSLLTCRAVPFHELDNDKLGVSITALDFMVETTLQGTPCQKLKKLEDAKPSLLRKMAHTVFPHAEIKSIDNGVSAMKRMAAARFNRRINEHMTRRNWDEVVAALQGGGQAVLRVNLAGAALTKPALNWVLLTRILLPRDLTQIRNPDQICAQKILERRPACVIWHPLEREYQIWEDCENLRKGTDQAVLIKPEGKGTRGPEWLLPGGGLFEDSLRSIHTLHCVRQANVTKESWKTFKRLTSLPSPEARTYKLHGHGFPFKQLVEHAALVPWVPMGSKQLRLAKKVGEIQIESCNCASRSY